MLKVFEAFSGVGAQRMALRNIGVEHEVVAISDIDDFAIKSYAAIHDNDKVVPKATDEEMQAYLEKRNIPLNDKGVRKVLKGKKLQEFYEACVKSNNLGDISKIDPNDIPDHDLFTYSFPCTDVSTAGRQLGFAKGSGTRSGLLWECEKVIDVKRPKYLLLENVKGLISNKFRTGFDEWLSILEGYGYTNYWGILNSKHYGVAQNRERVFVVSILGEHAPYLFPNLCGSIKPLREILEDDVTDRYTLSELKHNRFVYEPNLKNDIKTLGSSKAKESRIGQRDIIYSVDGIMGAIMASDYKQPKQIGELVDGKYRLRRLTPLEYWRLQGFSDRDFYKAKSAGLSETQLYKQAGNSISLPVLEELFKNLLIKG